MSQLSDMAAAKLANLLENKFERKAWNEMIRRAEVKGAILEQEGTCTDPFHKSTFLNEGMDCPRCSTCGKKVML